MKLQSDQIALFKTRGYIVIPAFFPAATVAAIADWMQELKTSAARPAAEARYYECSPLTGEPDLVRAEHIIGDFNPHLNELLLTPRVMGCMEELLGEPALLFKEKVNYKAPGCRADKLHQDQAAGWNTYCDFYITLALAVDENRADNAALTFLSSGNYPKKLMGPEWQPLSEEDPPYSPAAEYSLLEAQPGDVILFDSYVPHGSPANTSDHQRRNLYLTFHRAAAGDQRMRYYQDKWRNYPPNTLADYRSSDSFRV